MNDSDINPLAQTARDYLAAARTRLAKEHDAARTRTDLEPAFQLLAAYGLRMLARFLAEALGDIDEWEIAELASVYDTLALLIKEALGIDKDAAFRMLAVLCGDDDARRQTKGQAAPAAADLQLLRRQLMWVTVTYEHESGSRCRRTTEIAYQIAAGDPRNRRAELDIGYEDLPDRVRRRMFASRQQAVRYQLYPAPGGPEGGN
jgi:hypothetical protein